MHNPYNDVPNLIHQRQSTTGQFILAQILGVGHKNVKILGVGPGVAENFFT